MKKIYLLLLLVVVAAVSVSAQKKDDKRNRQEMRKEFIEFKMKFLAQEIDLKEDQEKKFFELYTQMEDERFAVMSEMRRLEKKAKAANASDADYEAMTKGVTTAKEKDALIEKKYDEKFSAFLTSKQMYKLKDAEEKFRQKMHEMRKQKKGPKK